MKERRKCKRTNMESTLIIKRVDGTSELSQEVMIDIIDVSKSGIGFFCDQPLMIGAVYESYLTIWTKEVLHAFLRICRIELQESGFTYGASFVGMPEMDVKRIETYQTIIEE